MSNVVSLSERRQAQKPAAKQSMVPQDIRGPIDAIIRWAESNGIDVENNIQFHFRLADFMALLQTAVAEQGRQSA